VAAHDHIKRHPSSTRHIKSATQLLLNALHLFKILRGLVELT